MCYFVKLPLHVDNTVNLNSLVKTGEIKTWIAMFIFIL